MSADGPGARLARRWVGLYTLGLPPDQAEQRRDEIRSDLWEHHDDSIRCGHGRLRHNLLVFERLLSGIPADLSWRRGIQRSRRQPAARHLGATRPTTLRSGLALVVMAALGIAPSLGNLALLGTGLQDHDLLWILGSITLAGMLTAGLALRLTARMPGLATVLLLIGAFAPTVAWFWLPPVYAATATIAILALVTGRVPPVRQNGPA